MASALRRFKLAPKYKWAQIAPHVKKVAIRFDPAGDGTVGAKEFWRQVVGPKVTAQYPKLEIKLDLTEGFEDPATTVTFSDGTELNMDVKNMSVDEILTEFSEVAAVMERTHFIPDYKKPVLEE